MGKKKDKKNIPAGNKPATLSASVLGFIDSSPVDFLVSPTNIDEFWKKHWERQPLLSRATESRKTFFGGLFDQNELQKLLGTRQRACEEDFAPPIEYQRDLVAGRYKDGHKENLDAEDADKETVMALYNEEGATIQFHQPQRFNDKLWRLLAALEARLGCLTGCNAYLTPAKTQGLAPHHDDVELFVVQTEGRKRWRLYTPLDGFELPSAVSGDLKEGEIGEPVLDVTLEVGDVLYLPRGTVHQAEALDGPSTHLTISTYQHWTYGNLLGSCLQYMAGAQHDPEALPLELRRGLPTGVLWSLGLQAAIASKDTTAVAKEVAKNVADGLRSLASHLEQHPELLGVGLQPMALDFLRSRIPPHPAQLPKKGPPPELDTKLVCRGPRNFLVTPKPGAEDQEDAEGYVRLCSSLANDRENHMMPCADDSDSEDEGDSSDDDDDDDEGAVLGASSDGEEAPEAVPLQVDPQTSKPSSELPSSSNAASHKVPKTGGGAQDNLATGTKKGYAAGVSKHKDVGGGNGGSEPQAEVAKKVHKGKSCCHHGTGSKPHTHTHDTHPHTHSHSEQVGLKRKGHHVHEVGDEDDVDEDEEESEGEDDSDDGVPGLLLPSSHAAAVVKVLESGKEGMLVKDLPLQFDAEKMQLAFALWAEGVVSCAPGGGHVAKKAKAG